MSGRCVYQWPKVEITHENHDPPSNSRHGYGSTERMESSYFMFGLSDWSISLFPDNSVAEADGSVEVWSHVLVLCVVELFLSLSVIYGMLLCAFAFSSRQSFLSL